MTDVMLPAFQARVERMEDFNKRGEEMNKTLRECKRKVAEAQKKVQELSISTSDDAKKELAKAQAEEKKLKKEEREWEKKMDEHNREEKKMPWNVDTLSKEGFSKVRLLLNEGLWTHTGALKRAICTTLCNSEGCCLSYWYTLVKDYSSVKPKNAKLCLLS